MTIINGRNFENFVKSFDPLHLHSVQQFLEAFDCCHELESALRDFINDARRVRQQKQRILAQLRAKEIEDRNLAKSGDPPPLPPIDKNCPECGAKMGGVDMPRCETKVSGRMRLEECSECSYYIEFFKTPEGPRGNRPWRKGVTRDGRRL